jgi:hypothetical protein
MERNWLSLAWLALSCAYVAAALPLLVWALASLAGD